MIVKENSGTKKQIPAGMHQACCYILCDIGTQLFEWGGESKKSRKIILAFQFPDHTIEIDGEQKPMVLSKEYNMSLNERATLRKHLEGWRSKKFTKEELEGFDLKNILGKGCSINVIENDKGWATIDNIMPAMSKSDFKPETVYFSFESADPSSPLLGQIPKEMPEWIVEKKIMESDEAKFWQVATPKTSSPTEDTSDDVPF